MGPGSASLWSACNSLISKFKKSHVEENFFCFLLPLRPDFNSLIIYLWIYYDCK